MSITIIAYQKDIARFYRKMVRNRRICSISTRNEDWTLRDMVGHLIDSASNNHQRFVRLQLEDRLVFPGYDAESWKRASHADSADYLALAALWKSYNGYILNLIAHIDEGALGHCWLADGKELTLRFLIEDYFTHMNWHEDLFDAQVSDIARERKQTRR